MRRATRLTVICGCMAVLGGCGAEKAADKVGRTVDPVAEAAQKTTASGGARMQGGIDIRVEGVTVPMTINGEISFEDQALQMRMNMGRIKGATQQVAGEIQAARNKAISKNVNLGVVFVTLSPTTYQWAVEDAHSR